MSTPFPVDVQSVKNLGTPNWSDELQVWPIGEPEFKSLYDEVTQLYKDLMVESPDFITDALTVMYKLAIDHVMLLHANIVVHRLAERGYDPSYQDSTVYFADILGERKEIKGLVQPSNRRLWPGVPPFKQRVRGRLSAIKNNVSDNRLDLGYYLGRSSRPHHLVLGYRNDEAVDFATAKGKDVSVWYPYGLFADGGSAIGGGERSEIETAAGRIAESVRDISAEHGVEMDQRLVDHTFHLTSNALTSSIESIVATQAELKGKSKTYFTTGLLGNTPVRTACAAARREGHRVVGLDHGVMMAVQDFYAASVGMLAPTDEYLVLTEGAADLYSKSLEKPPLYPNREIDVVSRGSTAYQKLWETNQHSEIPNSIKSVMFVEFPLNDTRHENALGFWHSQLDAALRVGKFLRSRGIRTVMKLHPDRAHESMRVYEGYFDEMLTVPFETVYQSVDAYFLPHLATSPFGLSLLTNKPVFIFEYTLNDVWEDVRGPLSRRCRVVPTSFDDNGRLIFDEDGFDALLDEKPESPDDEFVKTYMFPKPTS